MDREHIIDKFKLNKRRRIPEIGVVFATGGTAAVVSTANTLQANEKKIFKFSQRCTHGWR